MTGDLRRRAVELYIEARQELVAIEAGPDASWKDIEDAMLAAEMDGLALETSHELTSAIIGRAQRLSRDAHRALVRLAQGSLP